MPITFSIYEERGFFVSSWVDAISDSDLLSSYMQLFENEQYKPGFHEIADMRNAQMVGVTSEGMYRLASMAKDHLAGNCESFKTAVIAPEDLAFGLSRIYAAFGYKSPENVMVFKEPDKAFKWIGADSSVLKMI